MSEPIEVAADSSDAAFESIITVLSVEFDADNALLASREGQAARELEDAGIAPGDAGAEANRIVLVQSAPAPGDALPVDSATEARQVHPPATVERLNSAVRLTHEAMQAWLALVQVVGSDERLLR